MTRVSIIGATGYAGIELVRLLTGHPDVELCLLTSQSYVGQSIANIYPHLTGVVDKICVDQDIDKVCTESDVLFIALPHGLSVPVVQEAVKQGKKVIDLGADFRFDDLETYEQWYKTKHEQPELLRQSVYGLPELHREKIKTASVIGNPGCYPTSAILGLAPLLKEGLIEPEGIIIDAKSGVSGAGRGLSLNAHYAEANENLKAYNIGSHRHTPEIEQEAGKIAGRRVRVVFTPHLVPMTRGILSTIYCHPTTQITAEQLTELYRETYRDEPFVRVLSGQSPQTKGVYGSNYCDICVNYLPRTNVIIVVSAIDNLVKGAAGQAVQNMNILLGLPENRGLERYPIYP